MGDVFISFTESLDFFIPSGKAMAGMFSTFAGVNFRYFSAQLTVRWRLKFRPFRYPIFH